MPRSSTARARRGGARGPWSAGAGPGATVRVGPQRPFIGSVTVLVRYFTPDGCQDIDLRVLRVLGDCDGDGLADDVDPYPCDIDGDGDGVPDGWEIIMGTNPRDPK